MTLATVDTETMQTYAMPTKALAEQHSARRPGDRSLSRCLSARLLFNYNALITRQRPNRRIEARAKASGFELIALNGPDVGPVTGTVFTRRNAALTKLGLTDVL